MNKQILAVLLFSLLSVSLLTACTPTMPSVSEETTSSLTETNELVTTSATDTPLIADSPFDVPASMDEVRARTIEYFNAMSEVKWIAPETMDYKDDCPWTTHLVYEKGQTYYGLPYSTYRHPSAGIREFESYLDKKGAYTGPLEFRQLIGVDCGAMRCAWGYGGAICGFGMQYDDFRPFPYDNIRLNLPEVTVKVGDYDNSQYTPDTTTYQNIMKVNGEDKMYEAMAQLKACDLIGSRFELNGIIAQHVRMLVKDADVVRLGNGRIAATKSIITYSEQTSYVRTIDGKKTTWKLNVKATFKELFEDGYVPMTIASLKNETVTPIEMTASGFSKPENFASSPILKGTVKCNYNIFELHAAITDESGNVLSSFKAYPYALTALLSDYTLSTPVKELPAGTYRFTVKATIGFGEKTVADFPFTKE